LERFCRSKRSLHNKRVTVDDQDKTFPVSAVVQIQLPFRLQ
jgi:hypothetical protein